MAVVLSLVPMQMDDVGHQKLLGNEVPHWLYELEQVSVLRPKSSGVSSA